MTADGAGGIRIRSSVTGVSHDSDDNEYLCVRSCQPDLVKWVNVALWNLQGWDSTSTLGSEVPLRVEGAVAAVRRGVVVTWR